LRRQQFAGIPAAHPVQWLSDNGAIFAAHRTIEIALALNLVPCFTRWKARRATVWLRLS
jgi:putative transposase